MTFRFERLAFAIVLAWVAVSCTKSSPAQPSGPVSVTAPRPVQPVNNALVRNADQPITLSIQNAVATQGGATYTFEVGTDAAFATKVQIKDGVAETTGGQTSVRLDTLAPTKDYYWHARAQAGGTTGLFGATYKFSVGASVILDAPTVVFPLQGTQVQGKPTFVVNNSTRQGPAGPVTYKFDISTNAGFNPIALTSTVPEGPLQTTFTPATALAINQTYFWRVTALDASNNVSSSPSFAQSFLSLAATRQADLAAQLGVVLWPGIQPPGTNGNAVMGPGWDVQTLTHVSGYRFVSPTLEELRLFDLMDRGLSPQGAIDWMKGNGYPTVGAYYSSVQVIGVLYQYLALVYGAWELVLRSE